MDCDFTLLMENYGLSTVIIAVCVTALSVLFEIFFKDKMPALLGFALHFIAGIVLAVAYTLIFGVERSLLKAVSSGALSGSLGLAFKAFIRKLKSGKVEKDLLVLCVSEIIFEFVSSEVDLVAKKVANLIRTYASEDENLLIEKIDQLLKEHGVDNCGLAPVIVKSAKSLI